MRRHYLNEQHRFIIRIEKNDVWPHQQFPLSTLVIKLIFLTSFHPLNFANLIEIDVALRLHFGGLHRARLC